MFLETTALGIADWSMNRPAEAPPPPVMEARLLPAPPPPPPKIAPPPQPPPPPAPHPVPHIVAHHPPPAAAPEVKIGKAAPKKDQKTVAMADGPAANVTSEAPNVPAPPFEPPPQAAPPPPPAPVRPRARPLPVTRPPEVVEHPTPVLPSELRGQDFKGQALILFVVDAGGRAQPHLLQSTGSAQIDSLALDAARRWTFEPALNAGKPVPATLQVELQISVE